MAEKMPLTSEDIRAERIARLREDFPEVFTEGKVDFERLKQALGEEVAEGRERYGLSWAGKSEAIRNIQTPSVATLVPDRGESVEFDASENLFIEGDNLEVLKALQKGYHGQVKMIYIDPPYNTGNEFIYPDNFREGIEDYLRYSGQVSGDGIKLSTNTETGGRYHSKWLNMMYPRLFLARNLLREDGVIFVSIDDHEVSNLRMILDEMFGEENFLGQIIVVTNKGGQDYLEIAKTHEYLLCYCKHDSTTLYGLPKDNSTFKYEDTLGKYESRELRNRNPKFNRSNRPNLYYPIYINTEISDEYGYCAVWFEARPGYSVATVPKNKEGKDSCWRWGKERLKNNLILDDPISSQVVARQKADGGWNVYEKNRKDTTKAKSIWDEKEMRTENGTIAIRKLFGETVMDHPKPVELVKKCLLLGTSSDDVTIDFFSGSSTTAHAILEQNEEDGGNRKFIMVQLPEKTDNPDYPTIADISKERIRRVIKKLNDEDEGKLKAEDAPPQDRGFKVFKLTSSNFKIWDGAGASEEPEQLAEQLRAFAENILPYRSREDILYEILLKSGLPLTAEVKRLEVAGREVYAVSSGLLMVCLESHVDEELVRAMAELEPQRFVCLDAAFDGNDRLKTNTVLQMKDHGIEFRTV
jgi:adenine-specific DNA-methyltransferase